MTDREIYDGSSLERGKSWWWMAEGMDGRTEVRKARKTYAPYCCGREIQPGELYCYSVMFDGGASVDRTCRPCNEAAADLFPDDEFMWDWVTEELAEKGYRRTDRGWESAAPPQEGAENA